MDPEVRATINECTHGRAPWPLFLVGEAGRGKTCAALCVLDFSGGRYFTVPGLCDLLIQAQQGRLEQDVRGNLEALPGKVWPEGIWQDIKSETLVVLDEIGCREKISDAHYDAVKRCIDTREGMPFIGISNVSLEKLAVIYDARIASRLSAGTIIEIGGQDRRPL
jgi:hypothetical protein